MVDYDRKTLIDEVISKIEENLNHGRLKFESAGLEEMVRNLRTGEPTEETESNVLYLAWHIPSGVLPLAAEAVINLLVEEAFRK